MDLLYDVLKTWYLNDKESDENKRAILQEFRALFRVVSVQIDLSRMNGQIMFSNLKHQIPDNANMLAKLLGKYEKAMDENLVKIIDEYLSAMVKIGQDFNSLTHGSAGIVDSEIEELDKMSKSGKTAIDKFLKN